MFTSPHPQEVSVNSTRVITVLGTMPVAIATGQAAGVTAAFSAIENVSIRSIDLQSIQQELLRQGVDLGDLTETK